MAWISGKDLRLSLMKIGGQVHEWMSGKDPDPSSIFVFQIKVSIPISKILPIFRISNLKVDEWTKI